MPTESLNVRGLAKAYAGVRVVDDVDIEIGAGEVVCLLGENGAGKSTVAKVLAGAVRPDAGTMTFRGADYAPDGPADALAAGIGLIHQETNLLPDLTVAENVFLGRQPTRGGWVDRARMRAETTAALGRLGVTIDPDRPVRSLSVAALQQVEIAKAVALDAKILLLDEPTAALGPEDAERLFVVVDQLCAEGVGFVYISHRLEEIARVGTRIEVMRDGRQVRRWDRADVSRDELVEAMVGRSIDRVFPDPEPVRGQPLLEVTGLGRKGAFSDVSFTVHEGEILGVAGIVGAGRTELARALFGAEPADSGEVRLSGERVALRSPREAIAAGVALVPEDRKQQGLLLDHSVKDNVALASLHKLAKHGLVRGGRATAEVTKLVDELELKGRVDQDVATLSGGNQQKVVIAKWLLAGPRVLIFDEPTRGIDVGAKEAVYGLIRRLADTGIGVIVISSELPEVLGLSHRVLVLSRGASQGVLDRADATQERVMALAVAA